MFLVLTGHPEKAREYLDRTLKMNSDAVDAWVMRGWVEMYAGENPTKAIDYLEQAEKRSVWGRVVGGNGQFGACGWRNGQFGAGWVDGQ